MREWLAWQIVDSAFPTGLFAHSWGLESAWQHGEVADGVALQALIEASILQTAHATLPFVNTAYADPDRLAALDALADAFLSNAVANRASRVQGRTLLATAGRVWPSPELAALAVLDAGADPSCVHVAPISGVIFRVIGVSLDTAQRATLFGTARGMLSAAVRLGIVGSYEAQRLLDACGPALDRAAERGASVTIDDLAQTAPLIDLLQAGHDRLYSRLFQS